MDPDVIPPTLLQLVQDIWTHVERVFLLVVTPGWRQYQIGLVLALILLAFLAKKLTDGRLEEWARTREGWPKWRLRFLVQIRRRLVLVYFVLGCWLTYAVLQQVTWPSRSYLIGVAATLATAWLVIGLFARLVRNRTLRHLVSWTLWIYATLYALNLLDDVAAFLDSVSINLGAVRISVLEIITALVVTVVLLIAARLGSQAASASIRRNTDISPSMQVLAVKVLQVLFYGTVVIVGIRAFGFDLTGLALLSGAIGVGIGFGLQKVVSNLVSGVIILLDKSIKPGDVISLGETFGWINSLGARYVSVVTRDGREYLIPNEDLITSQVVNWSHSDEYVRLDIFFGASYGDDPHQVRKLAIEAAAGVGRVLTRPNAPVCHIVGFGDSSIDYILRFWISDPTEGLTNIKGNIYLALWDKFMAHGISIPFPQREVRILKEGDPAAALSDDRGPPGAS